MQYILQALKKILPKTIMGMIRSPYHFIMGFVASFVYGFPSTKMIVVGITGTTGKTTAVYMTAQALRHAGLRVGYTSTAMFSDGTKDWLNDKKMTMVGRFFTQKMLWRMAQNACDVAIVETTSEGAVQFRHRFINYDVMAITGLYPEHIESHGGFDNYKNAKKELFAHLVRCVHKSTQYINVPKTIIVNLDNEYADEFLQFSADRKIGFTTHKQVIYPDVEIVYYEIGKANKTGAQFTCAQKVIQMRVLGDFNATNATVALCISRALHVSWDATIEGIMQIDSLPGRLERIDEGQNFTVIVDYAFEPVAVTKLYETIQILEPRKIIHVLGSTGGGRDVARREELGRIAGKNAQCVIVTNEDPYDDDPLMIMRAVADGAQEMGKVENKDLFMIMDREQAIAKAVNIAEEHDVVLVTGKGSEQAIVGKDGVLYPWDDRIYVRKALQKIKK